MTGLGFQMPDLAGAAPTSPPKARPVAPYQVTRPCADCNSKGVVVCAQCNGTGSRSCLSCDCERTCRDCGGARRWVCEACCGFGCLAASTAWRDEVARVLPEDVARVLVQVAPCLDAGGLPKFSVAMNDAGTSASPVACVEVRADDKVTRKALAAVGFARRNAHALFSQRRHMECWVWTGAPVRLPLVVMP